MARRITKKLYQHRGVQSPNRFKKRLFIFLIVIVGLVLVLELSNTTHLFHKKTVPPTIPVSKSSSSKTPVKNDGSGTNSSGSSSPTNPTQSTKASLTGGPTNPTLNLVAPYGTFVSNHRPGQGSPNEENSVCVTTQGANCYIKFVNTNSGKTTQLPTQTTGVDGSTSWVWNANILTSGKWQLSAVASLNGQTKTTTDPTTLEIQ